MRRCTRGSIDDQASSISTASTATTTSTTTMESPDNDSAFDSDDISLMSSESSASSGSGMISGQARWARQVDPNVQDIDGRKFFVNIYCADGSTKESILIDSQMNVSTVIWLMSERSHVQCHSKWGLVEYIPELNIERCLEDHERLFETLLQWKPKSENRIIFAQRPEKYDLFMRPERYLPNCGDTIPGLGDDGRQALLTTFFSSDVCKAAQSDGLLWTKTEGKKSWKKHLFVLRDGNLFQATKCKKGASQDFVLVANIKFCRVYWGINWKKKLKAPNEFCFALTPPKLHQQEKGNTCMKYLCAEDEATRHKWTTLFRAAQAGRQLVENFCQLSGQPNFLPPRESKDPKPVLTVNNGDWQRQNGVVPPTVISSWQQHEMMTGGVTHQQLHRSDSELSSCCLSDVDSTTSSSAVSSTTTTENGFDTDHHEGGTIRRKPVGATSTLISALTTGPSIEPIPPPSPSVLPAPPASLQMNDLQSRHLVDVPRQFTESDLSLNSLPPPPEELRHLHRIHSITAATTCDHHIQQNLLIEQHHHQQQLPANNNGLPQQQPTMVLNGSQSLMQPTLISTLQHQVIMSGLQQSQQQQPPLMMNNIQQQAMMVNGSQMNNMTAMLNGKQQHLQQQPAITNGVQQQLQMYPTSQQQQMVSGQPQHQVNSMANGMPQQIQPNGINGDMQQKLIREEIYPCGIPRAIFQPGQGESSQNQMDLLKMLPNNPPPRPFAAIVTQVTVPDLKSSLKTSPPIVTPPASATSTAARRRRITFNELVHSVDDDDETEYHQLKGEDVTPTAEDVTDNYSERDVSNWVLQSLKHCRVNDTPTQNGTTTTSSASGDVIIPGVALPIIAHELRPKIYNGRSVPNCFPPSDDEVTRPTQLMPGLIQPQVTSGRKVGPPPPPKRSHHTQLTSPT